MTEVKPLLYSAGFILFFGFIIPFFLSFFINIDSIELSSVITPMVDVVEDGFTVIAYNATDAGLLTKTYFALNPWASLADLEETFTFKINPFNVLGDTLKSFFLTSFMYLGLLPDFLLIPLLILLSLSFLVSIVSLLPTT